MSYVYTKDGVVVSAQDAPDSWAKKNGCREWLPLDLPAEFYGPSFRPSEWDYDGKLFTKLRSLPAPRSRIQQLEDRIAALEARGGPV